MIQHVNVILASGSPRRKELLTRAGITFKIIKSDVDEVTTETDPAKVVAELSIQKARAVREMISSDSYIDATFSGGSIIVAADTVVAIDNKILGKPEDEEDAFRILMSLSGKGHKVFTGVSVLHIPAGVEAKAEEFNFVDETTVNMFPFTEDEARNYIKTGEPMDKAGAYGIQGTGGLFVSGIDGNYDNVVGFPLSRFVRECCERGYFTLY